MPRETNQAKQARIVRIIEQLNETYPDAHCELVHSNPLELLIATILSAQCTDKQVNKVTPAVFKKYRTAWDYAEAPLEDLEQDLKAIGLYRSKAKNIQACCRKLQELHQGEVPDTMAELVALDGVGRKTANVVLGDAFQKPEGIVVDTHVKRICALLGITRNQDPVKIERDLQRWIPREHWVSWSHWIIFHGRRRCSARKPDCEHCEIKLDCPVGVRWTEEPLPVVRAGQRRTKKSQA